MHHSTDRIIHTTAFVTPVVEHWLEREIAQWVHLEGSIWRPITPWANALTTELHLTPLKDGRICFSQGHTHYSFMESDTIKDYSDSERGNLLRHFMGYSFCLAARDLLYASSQTWQHTPQSLLHQLWSTDCNEKWLNMSTMRDRSHDSFHHGCNM